MSSGRRTNEQQALYSRQATILRKNLSEWDRMLRTPRGEDWPTMLGRLNAALNQTVNLDKSIDDVMEHFVYLPKIPTANPQDIPFFLSTRLELPADDFASNDDDGATTKAAISLSQDFNSNPVGHLTKYERNAAKVAADYEKKLALLSWD